MTKKEQAQKEAQKEEALTNLRGILTVGQTVYTSLKWVNKAGSSRLIRVYIVRDDHIVDISWDVGKLLDYKYDNTADALVVGGGGMDMGYHLVYGLGRALYPEGVPCTGYSLSKRAPDGRFCCNSNDHVNGDNDYTIGHMHSDGGYTFYHRWI